MSSSVQHRVTVSKKCPLFVLYNLKKPEPAVFIVFATQYTDDPSF